MEPQLSNGDVPGALFPANWLRPRFRFTNIGDADLFEIRLQAESQTNDLVVYTTRSEEHTSELQSHSDLVCRLLLEKKKSVHSTWASERVHLFDASQLGHALHRTPAVRSQYVSGSSETPHFLKLDALSPQGVARTR